MHEKLKMLLMSLLVGILLVAAIMTFIALGPAHLVPWLLVIALLIIPIYYSQREKKHFVIWKDEYSVGIDILDEDHKILLNLINKMQTAVHYKTGEQFEKDALDEIIDYTKYHFEREEQMLEDANYPELEAHKKQHRDMINKVDSFMLDYEKRGHETLEDVAMFLQNWLVNHINGSDQEYTPILKESLIKPN